jgi:hypothetical protein
VQGKTPVGVCFYINAGDKTDRRMVALQACPNTIWGPWFSVKFDENGTSVEFEDTPVPNSWSANDIALTTLTTNIGGHVAGEKIPIGQYDTLLLIQWRDRLLTDCGWDKPSESVGVTEKARLEALMAEHSANNGSSYYYPAASYCYAYKPAGDNVNAQYSIHQWYLPTVQEIEDLLTVSNAGSLGEAVSIGVLEALTDDWHWSCQESYGDGAYRAKSSAVYVNGDKSSSCRVRAVAAF